MGCDFWMDARREAPENLRKANERIRQLEAQVSKLEAELAEAKRRAAWYLDRLITEHGICDNCVHADVHPSNEPCNTCKSYARGEKGFAPAPVPDDFEVKNG